ncbi:MAG: Crp/Fnr family transcriptional regulator [Gammaproteobacteria bacterium]|nr:Crp/Fnr family transcriptional regulator [Gammaproteobacteria bacterium]
MKQSEKKLLEYFRKLSTQDAQNLLSFAEFLAAKSLLEPDPETLTVNKIERPTDESVIAAIKRLSASYPMLDKGKMLTETSSLMTQHVIQGRSAIEVIDELELVFERYYDAYKEESE